MRKATVIGFTPIKTKADNNKKSKNKVIKEDNNKINSAKE